MDEDGHEAGAGESKRAGGDASDLHDAGPDLRFMSVPGAGPGDDTDAMLAAILGRVQVGEPVRLPFGTLPDATAGTETTVMCLAERAAGRHGAIESDREASALRVGHEFSELAAIVPMTVLLSAFMHDIAQPLNVIKMAAYNLMAGEGKLPPDRIAMRIGRIEAQCTKADALLKGLRTLVGSAVWRRRSRPASEILAEAGPLVACFLNRFYIESTILVAEDVKCSERAVPLIPPVLVAIAADVPRLLEKLGGAEIDRDVRAIIGCIVVGGLPRLRLEVARGGDARTPAFSGETHHLLGGAGNLPLDSMRLLWARTKLAEIGGSLELVRTDLGFRFDILLPSGEEPPR